jgi:glycosyltransferase involved in cell wall biosynthesis
VDRHVPARVTYWTGVWRPGAEALSNEVAAVRGALAPQAPVVSFSGGQRTRLALHDRVIMLSRRRPFVLRALAAVVEPRGEITHAWGAIDDWHFLRLLGRKPLLFTVAFDAPLRAPAHYDNVALFVAESEGLAAHLRSVGVDGARIRVVYPGVDLDVFAPPPHETAPAGRLRVVFASAPQHVEEFADRGIPLLVELARACPDIDVALLWREWGDDGAATRAFAALDPPANIVLERRGARTMTLVYQSAHVVACIYADGFGKTTPNSVVEGLACGRPVLVGRSCGIADLVVPARAGHAVTTLDEAVAAVRALQADWLGASHRARQLAERQFGQAAFIGAYRHAYEALSPSPAGHPRASRVRTTSHS